MNFRNAIASLAIGAALVMGTAVAGSKYTGSGAVTVSTLSTGGTATGYLGHIYNSSSRNEYIGCQKSTISGVFCQARTESGVLASCSSKSTYLANAVSGLSPDARLTFRWDNSGRCVAISVSHSSEYQDKQG